MLDRTVSLGITEAYLKLKETLASKGCRTVSEDPPNRIVVVQGSLWGITPTNAKKTLSYNLNTVNSETRVTCSSRLSSDWKNLTLIGTALSIIVVGLCLWVSVDLDAFMVTRQTSFWSSIISVNSYVDLQLGAAFTNLMKALALFLSVMIVVEVVIALNAQRKVDAFSKQVWPIKQD